MANIKESMIKLQYVEFSNNPELFLHKHPNEKGFTLGGIYQKYDNVVNWKFVESIFILCNGDIKRASTMLYYDIETYESVTYAYYKNYYSVMKLDKIKSQIIVDEIFLFGVLSGTKNAIKLAQKCVGVKEDGIIGNITIGALNDCNEHLFSINFDKLEIEYFEKLIDKNEKLEKYLNGWKNRSLAV